MQEAGHLLFAARLVPYMCCLQVGRWPWDEDLGTVLQSGECLSWNLPVDGSEGVSGPFAPASMTFLQIRWLLELLVVAVGQGIDV